MTDADVISALNQSFRVALTLWGEGRGGSTALRVGIASTLKNRMLIQRPDWGLTFGDICLEHSQYSCWTPVDGQDNYNAVLSAARQLLAGNVGGPILRSCLTIATGLINGSLKDTVCKATHYYSPYAMIPRGRVPFWAVGKTPAATIDNTLFFAGVA